jgi:eukaryotic-like serine/threonine-protein kinase
MPAPHDSRLSAQDQPTVLDIEPVGSDGSSTLAAGQRVGPYRIVRLLGEGGMGAVYLAEQVEPIERPVALKLVRGQLRRGLAEAYFLVERQALARMDHPAIAKVYDAGTTPQGHPFFAMEWIDGPPLGAYCATRAPPLPELLNLFGRICMGVHHAHQRGVIHRDLKPSNVLVADVDGVPMPKIIDFGIAIGASRNTGGEAPLMQSAGTRGYMSPEQLRGKVGEIDIRSDVYALGVMLLELLAPAAIMDHAAAAGTDNRALHAALVTSLGHGESAAAGTVDGLAAIPAELRWLLARAMHPERAQRYESAQALAEDLERYARHYPLRAVPTTRAYRGRCFMRRNRGALFAAAIVALALIGGSTAAVIGMLHAREAATRANLEADKSRETSRFLRDVLSGVDPEEARDLDKTLLHKILDRAASRAAQELSGQPEVLADIEGTIGGSYNGLSEYKRALEHTRHAYDVARERLGPDHLLTLKLERQLAMELLNAGNDKEASELIAKNVESFTRVLGPEDKETLQASLDLVENQDILGDFKEAEQRVVVLIPVIERVDGHDGKLTIDALVVHAELLTALGRYAEAEPIFKDVLARETKINGVEHPKTLDTMNGFAIMYMESHRFAEGAQILQTMLPICEKIYGPEHAFTTNIVSNLAGALRQQGTPQKIAESGPYYRRALDGARKKSGDKHPNTIMATHNYANYVLDTGDAAQAIALQNQALALSTEVLGPDHAVTGEIHFGLGKALLSAKRYAEAEKHLTLAIAEKQKDFGADHWRMAEYITPLIEVYKDWGKPQLAAEWEAKRAALKPEPAPES